MCVLVLNALTGLLYMHDTCAEDADEPVAGMRLSCQGLTSSVVV